MNNALKTRRYIKNAGQEDIALERHSEYVSGSDMDTVYIELLCEKFRDRGISTHAHVDANKQMERERKTRSNAPEAYNIRLLKVSPYDRKYRTGSYKGKSYMSSDDFAEYYKDLRNYKMPHYYSRPSSEYAAADAQAEAERIQAAGKPSKKAQWLAVTGVAITKVKEIPSHLNAEELEKFSSEWFMQDKTENRRDGRKTTLPVGVICSFAAAAISLLMIVSSSVMVSRAGIEVKKLENELDALEEERDLLSTDLDLKNDMQKIRDMAVNEYGMVNGDFVNSKYLDLKGEESLETYSTRKKSSFASVLEAIGLKSE